MSTISSTPSHALFLCRNSHSRLSVCSIVCVRSSRTPPDVRNSGCDCGFYTVVCELLGPDRPTDPVITNFRLDSSTASNPFHNVEPQDACVRVNARTRAQDSLHMGLRSLIDYLRRGHWLWSSLFGCVPCLALRNTPEARHTANHLTHCIQ